MQQCQACKFENPDDAKFCVSCGKILMIPTKNSTKLCRCGKSVKIDFKFCPYCGQKMYRFTFCAKCGGELAPSDSDNPICSKCSYSDLIHCRICNNKAFSSGFCEIHSKTHINCNKCNKPLLRSQMICMDCRNIPELPNDFILSTDDYEYNGDREAMKTLRSIKPLNIAIESMSRKFGKSWLESRFLGTGIKVSDSQFPRIHELSIVTAKILGIKQLPDIYISGDIAWSSDTFGTESGAFIVLGTFLTKVLSDIELLFILGHEMAHVKSGHAMYRTVAQVMAGYTGPKGIMGSGILGLLDLKKIMVSAIELPLLSWLRESEITGDRAGLIAIGDIEAARKVLLLQALRSPDLYNEINQEAYLRQQEESESKIGKLSEFMSQNSPYVARRIKLLCEFSRSSGFHEVMQRVNQSSDLAPVLLRIHGSSSKTEKQTDIRIKSDRSSDSHRQTMKTNMSEERIRGICAYCKTPFSVLVSKLPKTGKVELRCRKCGKTFPPEGLSDSHNKKSEVADYSD